MFRIATASGRRLSKVSFEVRSGEIFVFLGPNGGGKSTLFRLLSTLLPLQSGECEILGFSLRKQIAEIRERIGVVFQSPSVDRKLTVNENLLHQGHLYGLRGAELNQRRTAMLERFKLTDRVRDRVETLSGGLRRRVELAKGLLHRPRLLLLDEPSTGLDPAARSDMWGYLRELRDQEGVTVVLTTHLLEEADKADRIAILDRGQLVALDSPDALRSTLAAMQSRFKLAIRCVCPKAFARGLHCRQASSMATCDWKCRKGMSGSRSSSKRFPGRSIRSHSASQLWKMCLSPAQVAGFKKQRRSRPRSDFLCRQTATSAPIESRTEQSRPTIVPSPWLAAWTLCRREWTRFIRQGNRVFGALGQPIVFWVLLSALLNPSFQAGVPAGASGQDPVTYAQYFFPGTLVMIVCLRLFSPRSR